MTKMKSIRSIVEIALYAVGGILVLLSSFDWRFLLAVIPIGLVLILIAWRDRRSGTREGSESKSEP